MSQYSPISKFKQGEILKCCVNDFDCRDENVFEIEIINRNKSYYSCKYKFLLSKEWDAITLYDSQIEKFTENYKLAQSPLNQELK